MANLFNVEEKESHPPIACLYGNETPLQREFVKQNASKFRIIIIAENKPSYLENYQQVYFVSYENSALLLKLEETIDYAIIYSEWDHPNSMEKLINKLKADHSTILFILQTDNFIKHLDSVSEYRTLPNARFALLGELLTRNVSNKGGGKLSKIIDNVITNRQITLDGESSSSVYTITYSDALRGIMRLLLGNFRNDTMHYLFYKSPETLLAATHIFARIDPDITITFSAEKNTSHTISREELKSVITTRLHMTSSFMDSAFDGFEKGILDVLEETPENIPLKGDGHNQKKAKNSGKKRRAKQIFKFATISLFCGFFVFFFVNLLFLGLGLWYLRSAVDNLKRENFKSISQDAKNANFFLNTIKPTVDLTLVAVGLVDSRGVIQKSYALAERAGELSEITGSTISLLFKTSKPNMQTLSSVLSNFSFLYQEGQRILLETENKALSEKLKSNYSKLLSFSQVLPTIVGFYGSKDYLLLFQNDEELRATGGFIGSIGDLSLKDGVIRKLTVQDVYELDGQLKNHIEPPFIVRRYLQPHLYLRDSNFSLNFQEAASASALIYNLETGRKPDGVIAVNLGVLKRVLKITGPILLDNYNVTITAQNVSDFLQTTIKNNFFPGSTQKRDVLNNLLNKLVEKITSDRKFYASIVELLPDLLEEKDILVSFRDNSIQKIFSANGYAGEYSDNRISDKKNINDFLYINESNIGVNKVNAFITRAIAYNAMVGQGGLESKATINLTNTSPTDDYLVYIQAVVPNGSSIKQILINGVKQEITPAITDPKIYEGKNFKAPTGLEMEQTSKDNYSHFAFKVTAKKGGTTTIVLAYNNGAGKTLATIANYSLHYVKQPGTTPYKVKQTIDYPDEYVPVNTKADSYGQNFLQEEHLVKNDFITGIELQKTSVRK